MSKITDEEIKAIKQAAESVMTSRNEKEAYALSSGLILASIVRLEKQLEKQNEIMSSFLAFVAKEGKNLNG